jgi:hypothetical protein
VKNDGYMSAINCIPPIINTAEMLSVIGMYIADDATSIEDERNALKEVDKALSLGSTDVRISLLAPDKIFFGLGNDAWKDIIDGKYHALGPLVFDKPRAGHSGERGFYRGVMSACEKASKLIFNPSIVPHITLYKIIHRNACQHFTGKDQEDNTLIPGSSAGQFRMLPEKGCSGNYQDLFIGDPSTFSSVATGSERWLALRTLTRSFTGTPTSEVIAMCASNGIVWDYDSLTPEEKASIRKECLEYTDVFDEQSINRITRRELFKIAQMQEREAEKRWKIEIGPTVQAKIKELNAEIKKRSAALDITDTNKNPVNLAYIFECDGKVIIRYTCRPKLYHEVVNALFTQFQQAISVSISKAERRRCIADLYQMLEWVHPFPDGQGRTDLIMLKALLVTYGLTPAILDEPYMASFCSLNTWDAYLASSMKKWIVEFTNKKATSA